jgi:hypothetical protein
LLCEKQTHTNHTGENYAVNFPTKHFHLEITIPKLVKKVQINGILIARKPLKRNRLSTEEKLDDISH